MTQRNKSGMEIRLAPNPRKKDLQWLIRMLVSMAAAASLALAVSTLTGTTAGAAPEIMLGVSAGLCVLYGILVKKGQESWFYIGVLALILVLTLCLRRQVLEGFRISWNRAGDTMLRGTGWLLPEWELQLEPDGAALSASLFAGVVAGFSALACCGLTSAAPVVLAVLLPAAVLWGMGIFGVAVESLWLLPVLGTSVLILMYSGWRRKGSASAVLLSWGICIAAACFLIAGVSTPGIREWTRQTGEDVHRAIHERNYETKYTGLPEGDFSDYEKSGEKAVPALAVTMDVPQRMYLRGFTGAVFSRDSWQPLNKDVLVKNKQLLYWLNLNVFDGNAQYSAAASNAGMQQTMISVQNMGECSFYRYVPFHITPGEWTQPENLNTDGVYGEGERSYHYMVTGTAEDIPQVLTFLQTSDDPAVLRYRKAESGYRQFVYHHYLQVPQEVADLLKEYWDDAASLYGPTGNLTQQQAQECTLIFLSRCFTEKGTPEYMKLPLEMAEDTSFQYATVAALTLRYFGIPARYAEGYVITAEMAAGCAAGQTISVDSSCAKAWVEVYQDGIGWIPMDLTPGLGEILESKDADGKNNGKNLSGLDAADKKEEPQEENSEKPDSTGGTVVRILLKAAVTALLAAAVLAALIFLILWVRRKILLGRKEAKFRSENCSDAVAWIYADTALILNALGFDRGNGSMRSLLQPMQEKYGPEFAGLFAVVTDLNHRAMFSSRPLEEEQRAAALNLRACAVQKLKPDVKWYKRMWLKWVRCLY